MGGEVSEGGATRPPTFNFLLRDATVAHEPTSSPESVVMSTISDSGAEADPLSAAVASLVEMEFDRDATVARVLSSSPESVVISKTSDSGAEEDTLSAPAASLVEITFGTLIVKSVACAWTGCKLLPASAGVASSLATCETAERAGGSKGSTSAPGRELQPALSSACPDPPAVTTEGVSGSPVLELPATNLCPEPPLATGSTPPSR